MCFHDSWQKKDWDQDVKGEMQAEGRLIIVAGRHVFHHELFRVKDVAEQIVSQ
jgi:hypothetical protein